MSTFECFALADRCVCVYTCSIVVKCTHVQGLHNAIASLRIPDALAKLGNIQEGSMSMF